MIGLWFFHSRFFGALNINVHDSYFVTTYSDFTVLLSTPFLLFFFIYFIFILLRRPLKRILGLIHFIMTSLSLSLILIGVTLFPIAGPPRRYYPGDDSILDFHFFDINTFIVVAFFLLIVGQIIFVINLFWTILGRKAPTNTGGPRTSLL